MSMLDSSVMRIFTLRKLSIFVVCFIVYLIYILLKHDVGLQITNLSLIANDHVISKSALNNSSLSGLHNIVSVQQSSSTAANFTITEKFVDIWSKASIGSYFWEHIIEASVEQQNDAWSYGEAHVRDITLRFYTGPGIVPHSMPADISNIVLIVNGHAPSKIGPAQKWLKYVAKRSRQFLNVVILMLGNEQCNNSWIMKYLVAAGGPVKAVFVVYDDPVVDNSLFYQWPLGVATYRKFPFVELPETKLNTSRPFHCNFIGTIYSNSSRETLLQQLQLRNASQPNSCFVKARTEWLPLETEQSMAEYVSALCNSDLTLNPVGKNVECYRIYEAMACGSVPVIEDRAVSPSCGSPIDKRHRSVLRLLKRYAAPVIFVSNWHELSDILERERAMPSTEKVLRRHNLVNWYRKFRRKMQDIFLDVVDNFFV